jgi:hypothetical protein
MSDQIKAQQILKKALLLNAVGLLSVPFVFNFLGSKIFLQYLDLPVPKIQKIFWSVVILAIWFVSFFSFFFTLRWAISSFDMLHALINQ